MCALVCIGACVGPLFGLFWSLLDCIGIYLVNVLGPVLAHIGKIGMSVFACIFISYILNTNAIPANTYNHVLACIAIYAKHFLLIGHVFWYVFWYVLSLYLHIL